MHASGKCKKKDIKEILDLLEERQNLIVRQDAIQVEIFETDGQIATMRKRYGLRIEPLVQRLEAGDCSAIAELQSLFEEFLDEFDVQYKRLVKLRRKSEKIQAEIYKIAEEIIDY